MRLEHEKMTRGKTNNGQNKQRAKQTTGDNLDAV